MFEVRPRIEQLEMIANLLDQSTPSSARLAVILTDNLAEIIMHGRIQYEFGKDSAFPAFRPPKWPDKKRRDVTENFDSKVKFLVQDIGIIDADEGEFVKFAHAVRNAAYHADAYHRDVIGQVARTYIGIVARMFSRIKLPGVAYSMSQGEQDFLKRHGVAHPHQLLFGGLERICDAIATGHVCSIKELAGALSGNLTRRIDGIIGNDEEHGLLETLLDGNVQPGVDIEHILKHIQFVGSHELESSGSASDAEFRAAIAKWEAEFANFRAPVTITTLQRWRATARSIASDNTLGRATTRFKSIDEQLTRIEDPVHEAVREFDDWVNSQV